MTPRKRDWALTALGLAFAFGAVGWLTNHKADGVALGTVTCAVAVVGKLYERAKHRREQALAGAHGCATSIIPHCWPAKNSWKTWQKKNYLIYKYPETTPDPDEDKLARLQKNMGLRLNASVRVTVAYGQQYFRVERMVGTKPVFPVSVPHPGGLFPGTLTIPIGVDVYGNVVTWTLARGFSHALVGGQTGKGKSSAMRTIATEVASRGPAVFVCDIKRISVGCLRGWPGVREVQVSRPGIEDLLGRICAEMDKRYAEIESQRVRRGAHQRWVVFIDEVADLFDQAQEDHKAMNRRGDPPILVAWRRLLRLGSEAGIHVIAGTQRPDARIVGGDNRSQFTVRLGVCVNDSVLMNMLRIKTQVSEEVQGRAILNAGQGDVEIQTYWTPEPVALGVSDDDRAILDALSPGWATPQSGGIEPQAKVVRMESWKPSKPGTEYKEGVSEGLSSAHLTSHLGARGAGQDATEKTENGSATENDGPPSWCPVHGKSCVAALRGTKREPPCHCDVCKAWQRWDNARRRAKRLEAKQKV